MAAAVLLQAIFNSLPGSKGVTMHLKIYKLFILIVWVTIAIPAIGYAQLTLDGQYRPRTEIRDGYQILSSSEDKPAFFTSQRTRLALTYEQQKYRFKISGQDVRTWGEVGQLDDTPSVNIYEAWAQLMIAEEWTLQLGRQELVYDDQRLLGSVNWAQQGRTHDAIRIKYRNRSAGFMADIGGAYNQEGQKLLGNHYALDNYKVLSYLWIKKTVGSLTGSAILLTDGFEISSGAVNYRYTYGGNLNYLASPLKLSGTVYLQQGDDRMRRNISAYMLGGKASYNIGNWLLTGGYDYLSGGKFDDQNSGRHAFNTLYATGHKFNGHMDYFTNIPADTRGGGLQDWYFKAGYELNNKANANLTYHHFSLAHSVANPLESNSPLGRNLASELDFSLTYSFSEEITFRAGYSILFEDETLELIQERQADGAQQWGWAMLVLSPKIIN